MALELEVLILIPNDSHLADEANKNHIICKKVRWDSEATKVEAFCHMAILENLSIKTTKRVSDKG